MGVEFEILLPRRPAQLVSLWVGLARRPRGSSRPPRLARTRQMARRGGGIAGIALRVPHASYVYTASSTAGNFKEKWLYQFGAVVCTANCVLC